MRLGNDQKHLISSMATLLLPYIVYLLSTLLSPRQFEAPIPSSTVYFYVTILPHTIFWIFWTVFAAASMEGTTLWSQLEARKFEGDDSTDWRERATERLITRSILFSFVVAMLMVQIYLMRDRDQAEIFVPLSIGELGVSMFSLFISIDAHESMLNPLPHETRNDLMNSSFFHYTFGMKYLLSSIVVLLSIVSSTIAIFLIMVFVAFFFFHQRRRIIDDPVHDALCP